VSQLKPATTRITTKLANAEALVATNSAPPVGARTTPRGNQQRALKAAQAPVRNLGPRIRQTRDPRPIPAVAALSPPESKTYSNDAPPGQTN